MLIPAHYAYPRTKPLTCEDTTCIVRAVARLRTNPPAVSAAQRAYRADTHNARPISPTVAAEEAS